MLANTSNTARVLCLKCYPGVTNQQLMRPLIGQMMMLQASHWSRERREYCMCSSAHVLHKFRGSHFPSQCDPGVSNVTLSLSPANHPLSCVWAHGARGHVTRVTVSSHGRPLCPVITWGRGKLYDAGTMGIRGSNVAGDKLAS